MRNSRTRVTDELAMDFATLRTQFEELSIRADELLDEAFELCTAAANALEEEERISFGHLMREASARVAVVAVLYEALASECKVLRTHASTTKPS